MPAVTAIPQRAPLRILLAEPHPAARAEGARLLAVLGHAVAAVDCGEAALDALLRGEADAGILAPDLPAIPGLEVAKLLRFATIGRARPPLVALVDRSDARLERACREAGFDACLARPLSPEATAAALAEALAVPEPAPCLARAGVARIDAHPDFARGARTLDPAVLADLEALGGPTFLAGLAAGFIADMDEIRDGLDALAAAGAAGPFRERIHALRSAAAQIGALRLYRFCLAWRGISPRQLRAAEAAGRLRALDREIARARRALLPYVDRAAGRTA